MISPLVVSLCDYTGNVVRPWAAAGYDCLCIDIAHETPTQYQVHEGGGTIWFIKADLLDCVSTWLPVGRVPAFACGFPPCTHTAVSGAKYFRTKGPRAAAEAFAVIARVAELLQWFGCPYFYEQPVATSSTYCGKPSCVFDPCDYAGYSPEPDKDAYTKRTCLWTGGGFVMPEAKRLEPVRVCAQGSWVQKLGGKSERTKRLRSATPLGFSQAVYEANHKG